MELRCELRAPRALKRLGDRDRTAMVDALEAFVAGRLPNADVRKLRAVPPSTCRPRVGNLRALYRRLGDAVLLVHIDDRKDVYRS